MSHFRVTWEKLRYLSTFSRLVSKGKKSSSKKPSASSNYIPEKVFELRTYSVKPEHFKSYVNLTNQFLHLRTSHSKLVGFWTAELGGLNQAIHIWEYDDLEHRAQVRKDLATDTKWFDAYLSKMLPMVDRQDNLTMTLLPCCLIEIPAKLGVYELMRFTSAGGTRSTHKEYEEFINVAKEVYAEQASSLIGCFVTDYGPNHTMICLWQHETFDTAALAKRKLWKNSDVLELPFTKHLRKLYSIGMIPLPVSPLQ